VEEWISGKRIVRGSCLEAVPLGSITHLIEPEAALGVVGGHRLAVANDLVEQISRCASKSEDVWVAVAVLCQGDELASNRGTASVNDALAKLFGALHAEFHDLRCVAQTTVTELAMLVPQSDSLANFESRLSSALASASERTVCWLTVNATT
jgi:hypothetical protein